MTALGASLTLKDQFTSVLQKIDSGLNKATKSMESFKQKVSGPAKALQELGNKAGTAMSKVTSSIKSGMSQAAGLVQSVTEKILSIFGSFGNRISSRLNLSGVASKLTSTFSGVSTKVSSTFSSIGRGLGTVFSAISSKASSLGTVLASGFKGAMNAAKSFTSRLGSFFNGAKNSFKQFGNDLRSGFSGIGESGHKATTSIRSFATALGLVKVAGVAINVVKHSLDGAIERFDTLNQFPKMMQAIGFSAQDAAKSKDALIKGIDGLPTTLGEVVSTTQRIATLTRDLDGATKTTIALNNAFLASGSSSADASRGLEQYVQMLSRGEVDLQSWRSLQDTMGPALYDVAEAFGFAGKSAQNDLYDALKAGHVTFDQFNNKLIELNEGVGGFAERALIGSEGIKTSFKNIRTAVTNGMEGAIRKVDTLVEKMTGKNIAQSFDGVKEKIKDLFAAINGTDEKAGLLDKLPGLIKKITPYVDVLKHAFQELKAPIGEAIAAVKKSLSELTGGLGSEASVSGFQSFVTGITDAIKGVATFAEQHSDSIAKVIRMLPQLAAAFIGFKIGKGVLSPLLTFGKGVSTVLGATGKLGKGLAGAFGSLFGFGGKPGSGGPGGINPQETLAPVKSFGELFKGFAKNAGNLLLVFGVIKLIEAGAQALKTVNDKVPQDLSTILPKLLNMGIALAGMGAFVVVAGKFANKNPQSGIAGLLVMAGISANLLLAAEAMKQINEKVPDNLGAMALKLGSMAIAIGGMAILVGVVGALVNLNPVAAVAGLATVALISLELMLAAEAMQQVNEKVPSNIGDFARKLANMAIAIGGMTVLVGVVGLISSSGIGTAAIIVGLAAVAAIALELMLVAEAIQQMDNKIPEDLSSVKAKIDNIARVIGYFTAANLGSVIDLFQNVVGVINTAVVTAGLRKFERLAEELETFSQLTIPTGIEDKIAELKRVLVAFGGSSFEQLLSNIVTAADILVVNRSISSMIEISEGLGGLERSSFSFEAVSTKIKEIKQAIDLLSNDGGLFSKIKDVFSKALDVEVFSTANNAFQKLVEIGNSLMSLQGIAVDLDGAKVRVEKITDVVSALGTSGLSELVGTMIKNAQLVEVKSAIEGLVNLLEPLEELTAGEIISSVALTRIKQIGEIIEALGVAGIGQWLGTMVKSAQIREVKNTIEALGDVRDALIIFGQKALDTSVALDAISKIKAVLNQLNSLPESSAVVSLEAVTATFQRLTTEIGAFNGAASASIASLNGVSRAFNGTMTTIQTSVSTAMVAITSATVAGMATFTAAISTGMATAARTAKSGSLQIVTAFSGLNPQLRTAGMFAMSGLAVGIQAGAGTAIAAARTVASQVTSTIQSALKIASPSRVMMAVGQFVSQGLAKGILAAQHLVSYASSVLASAAIPDQLATVSASGSISSNVFLDDEEISRLKASTSQTVVVNNKQLVPQVSLFIENKGEGELDEEALLQAFEAKVIELIDSDLS